jgi:hypothetical protein
MAEQKTSMEIAWEITRTWAKGISETGGTAPPAGSLFTLRQLISEAIRSDRRARGEGETGGKKPEM